MEIESKYIRKEGGFRKTETLDFPSFFLDLLLKDEKLSKKVIAARLPGEKVYRDAEKSSQVGKTLGFFIGLGWKKFPLGFILFCNSPISGARIKIGRWWAHMMCFTSRIRSGSFGNVEIKPKTKGYMGRKGIVGIEIKGDDRKVQGLSDLRNDSVLIEKIMALFKSNLLIYEDYKGDFKTNEIRFTVVKNPFRWFGGDKEEHGIIETGLSRHIETIQENTSDYASLCKTSFEVIIGIANHLRSMWSTPTVIERIEKAAETKEAKRAKERLQLVQMTKRNPSDANSFLSLARAFLPGGAYVGWDMKKKEDALKSEANYQKAIQIDPSLVDAYLELGFLHVAMKWQMPEKTEALVNAENELKEALRINPNLPQAHRALAYAYRLQKMHDECKKHLELVLQSRPDDKLTRYWLGVTYMDLGREEEANKAFQKIFPEFNQSRHRIERSEMISDFYTRKVEKLGLVIIDKDSGKRIRYEEVQDFSWLD